jgi:hypothetical protein
LGGVIINGERVAFQNTLVTMGKMVAIDMVTTGVTYGTSELCQKMGMPGSVTMLLSMLAGGKVGSTLNNKWLANLSAEDAARFWKNLEPGEKLPPGMTGDEYAKYLKGLGHVDDASALGKVDYEEVLRARKEGASRAKYEITWNKNINATQEVIEGTNIPKSFTIKGMKVNGNEVWVHGNATKHMGEFVKSAKGSIMVENELLLSFQDSLTKVLPKVQPGRNFFNIGGWEIGINGDTGVIYHALYK